MCRRVVIGLAVLNCVWAVQILSTDEKSCKLTTDEGKIDLSPLAKSDGTTPSVTSHFTIPNQNPPVQTTLYWNPCNDFSFAASGGVCKDSELCIEQSSQGQSAYVNVGNKAIAEFKPKGNAITLQYANGEDQTVVIELHCDSNTGNLDYISNEASALNMKLRSRYACYTGGLSAGSILCIILLVLVVLYLAIGILAMKLIKKAQGLEVIPNIEFWEALPGLVKTGAVFLFRGCKTDTSYDDI